MATAADLTKDDLDGLMVLLADVRDEIGEAAKHLARVTDAPTTPDTLARIEERLAGLARTQAPHAGPGRRWLAVALLAALGGAGGGWYVGGYGQREMRAQATLMGKVDALLVTHSAALPAPVQKALQEVYTHAGFHAPGQRSPKGETRRKTGERP